jgi:hypothetical protein
MATDNGNWHSNQKEVSAKIQNIAADGASFTGDVTGDVTGLVFGTVTTYVADGAIALTDSYAILDASSASTAMTLADGTKGQEITIFALNTTNTCDVDYTGAIGPNTVTFTPAGEYIRLLYNGSAWLPLNYTGAIS